MLGKLSGDTYTEGAGGSSGRKVAKICLTLPVLALFLLPQW